MMNICRFMAARTGLVKLPMVRRHLLLQFLFPSRSDAATVTLNSLAIDYRVFPSSR
jgi:hypothetical protein